jgi:signal transduction histidine kinase
VPATKLLRTSSFRLTLAYAFVFVLCVLVLFGVTYVFISGYATQDETDEIGVEFADIQNEAVLAGQDRLPQIIDAHIRLRKDVRAVYLLLDSQGRKITGNLDAMKPVLGPTMMNLMVDGRIRAMRGHGYQLDNGSYLFLGQDTSTLNEMTELIVRAFGVGLVATLMIALLGGALISRSVLGRIETVGKTTRAIIDGDLAQRVPLHGSGDEFDDLAMGVNAMLDRIEDLMRSMRQVSNDVAHDLRTPLTRLRQRLERARLRADDRDELQDALASSITQVDSILDTFGALLRIAQIEAGGRASPPAPVNVSKLLTSIVEDFAPAAEDHGQRIVAQIDNELTLSADRELLTQMVVNLVDNAIRHSPPGTEICVQGKLVGDHFELAVADSGPGIPLHERENVLRPFYRLEASRTTEGSGLGLSLVAAIAKRHHAKLSLLDNAPGLRVAVAFPLAA